MLACASAIQASVSSRCVASPPRSARAVIARKARPIVAAMISRRAATKRQKLTTAFVPTHCRAPQVRPGVTGPRRPRHAASGRRRGRPACANAARRWSATPACRHCRSGRAKGASITCGSGRSCPSRIEQGGGEGGRCLFTSGGIFRCCRRRSLTTLKRRAQCDPAGIQCGRAPDRSPCDNAQPHRLRHAPIGPLVRPARRSPAPQRDRRLALARRAGARPVALGWHRPGLTASALDSRPRKCNTPPWREQVGVH